MAGSTSDGEETSYLPQKCKGGSREFWSENPYFASSKRPVPNQCLDYSASQMMKNSFYFII